MGSKAAAQAGLAYAQVAHDPLLEAEALWLWAFGLWRLSRLQEGKTRAQAALSLVQTAEGQAARWLEAEVLRLLGVFMFDPETLQQCYRYLEDSLRLCREFGNRRAEATVLNSLGVLAIENSEYDRARTSLEQSLRIAREIGSRADEYSPLANLGEVCLYQEDHARGIFYYEQALPVAHETGNLGAEGQALITLGQLAKMQGDFGRALACFEQSLELMKRSGEPRYLSAIYFWFAMFYLTLGDYIRYDESQEQVKHYSQPKHWNARSIFDRGWRYLSLGDPVKARSCFKQRLADILISQEPAFEADVYASLGYACLQCNEPGEAAEAFQKVIEIRQKIKQNQGVAEARAGLAAALAAQSDLKQAQPELVGVPALLESTEILWMTCPELAYLNCYEVLSATDPAQAKQVLQAAYRRLEKRAVTIPTEELRQSFWQNVLWNREVKALYESGKS
jgi:tetratricopeptide (TPR) repeat protein